MNTFIKLTWRKIPHMVNVDHITFYKPTDCTDHNRGTEVYHLGIAMNLDAFLEAYERLGVELPRLLLDWSSLTSDDQMDLAHSLRHLMSRRSQASALQTDPEVVNSLLGTDLVLRALMPEIRSLMGVNARTTSW